jgi:hypothetical protein
LVVTVEPDTEIDGLTAEVIDLTIAPDETFHESQCPSRACVYVFNYPLWDISWDFTSHMGIRLWAVDRPDGNRLIIVAQADDEPSFQAFAPDAEKALGTVTFP